MKKTAKMSKLISSILVLILILSLFPMVANAADDPTPVGNGLSQEATGTSKAVTNTEEADKVIPTSLLPTPVLVSPANTTTLLLQHYPRTTNLCWRPVTGATYYKVERQYQSGSSWVSYSTVTVSGNSNTSYKFNFVGDQIGRWRVRAYNSTGSSYYSAWWYFKYTTASRLSTPIQISPVNNINVYHYPRATTMTWQPVYNTTRYLLNMDYYSSGWKPYINGYSNGWLNASYSINNFVGAQPGRWRVQAQGSPGYSYFSSYRTINYHL